MLMNPSSFEKTSEREDGTVDGTVEVTLRGTTKRVPAVKTKFNNLIAKGLSGRYASGSKVWPAYISLYDDGREVVRFGRDDRDPKFRKENAIYFAKGT